METRIAPPSMRDPNRDLQISRPSTLTNAYRAPSLTPVPSILAKRTISEDCTQGPEAERPRKYHCLQKEAERRATPRLEHLKKPAVGLLTGRSPARPSTRSPKPLKSVSILGTTDPGPPLPPLPPPRIPDLKQGYEVDWGWVHPYYTSESAPIDPSPGLLSDGPRKMKDRYKCRLCPLERRGVFENKGVLRRHIRDLHYPEFFYSCGICDPPNTKKFRRMDQFREHMRIRHSVQASKDQLAAHTERIDPPLACALCSGPVETWDKFHECLSRHCHISENNGQRNLGREYRAGDALGPQERLLPQPPYRQNCTFSCPAHL